MKYGCSTLLVALALAGCAPAPPNLTPTATAAFYKTRVIKALDVVRDTAIDAAATTPPLMTQASANTVVKIHRSALRTIQASAAGWPAAVQTALDEGLKNLPKHDADLVAPYVALVKVLLQGVTS